jgi:hypothetical protein
MAVSFMPQRVLLAGLLTALLAVSPAAAQLHTMPLRFVTSDGTFDCKSPDGTPIGTVVIVGSAYAFIKTDSKVGGYGTLRRHSEENYDLPHYIVMDGPLKDMGFIGTTMRGPREDYENYSTGIFFVLIPPDDKEIDCVRRMVDGMLQ